MGFHMIVTITHAATTIQWHLKLAVIYISWDTRKMAIELAEQNSINI